MPLGPLAAYLKTAEALAQLRSHADRLTKLQRVFEQIAPSSLARLCQVADVSKGIVVIYAANSAVAAKLRQMLPRLRDDFSVRCPEVTEVRVRVQVAVHQSAPAATPARPLGEGARASLAELAERLGDEPLGRAIGRLLERAAKG